MATNDSREAAFLREALTDPAWLLQQIDLHSDRSAFLRVPESTYRDSPFLDHRLKAPRQQPVIARLSALMEAARTALLPATSWIFHPGHVGSTLLSRLLGELDVILPVREPLPLRNVGGLYRELDHPLALLSRTEYERLEHAVFAMIGRTFSSDQRALVKATSDCCILLGRALRANGDSKAIWLHVDLETFLAGMLRNDVRRHETRGFAQTRLWDLHDLLGDQSIRLHDLDIGRITAVSWLASQGHLLRAHDAGIADRVLELHFHDLLDDTRDQLRAILEHFGIPPRDRDLDRMLDSRWRGAYAKDPRTRFGTDQRYRQIELSLQTNREAIAGAMAFAEDLCRRFPVLEPLSSRLRRPSASPETSSGKTA